MGDLQTWLGQPNGRNGDYNPPPSPSQPSNPHPSTITNECWRQAELATKKIVKAVQPTLISEQRRRAVVEYVQKLIKRHLKAEVFPFGSVPLKTYLPDGDIDLTSIGVPSSVDALASELRSILEGEEKNNEAEFEVKDVQYIHAEVDRHIGNNNLFKRSIILIKAWCYHESRILGAHHGLISTYALETLVLYILHLFHSSLNGPLAVLYRFLDYFSKFDWDNYCVSLHGPISLSSLPELVAEAPENDGASLLLSKEFLRSCVETFSDPPKGLENNSRIFVQKHLNILDPLKENNNLGRSVSRGNFYRIRSAFSYGARKLGRILLMPTESIAREINMFFMNTLDRHGSGERPDVQGMLSEGKLCEGIDKIKISSTDVENSIGNLGTGKSSSGTCKASLSSEAPVSLSVKPYHPPHLYFGPENGYESPKCFGRNEEIIPIGVETYYAESSWYNNPVVDGLTGLSRNTYQSEYPQLSPGYPGYTLARKEGPPAGTTEATPKLNHHLRNLTGDYDMHFKSLLCAQSCRESSLGTFFVPIQRPPPSLPYRNKYSLDAIHRPNMHQQMSPNGIMPRPPFSPLVFYPMNTSLAPGVYSMDDIPKARGTGTYFPNTSYQHFRDNRQLLSRGRVPVSNQLPRPRSNGQIWALSETNYMEKSNQDPPSQQQQNLVPGGNNDGKPALLETPKSPQTGLDDFSYANGILHHSDSKVELGSTNAVQLGASSQEVGNHLDSSRANNQGYGSTLLASTVQKPVTSSTLERSRQMFQLKDTTDFPPLT